jgi:hypothetical protein
MREAKVASLGQEEQQHACDGQELCPESNAAHGQQQKKQTTGGSHAKWLCNCLRLFAGRKQIEEELRKLQLRQVGLQQQQKQLQAAKDHLDLRIMRR